MTEQEITFMQGLGLIAGALLGSVIVMVFFLLVLRFVIYPLIEFFDF